MAAKEHSASPPSSVGDVKEGKSLGLDLKDVKLRESLGKKQGTESASALGLCVYRTWMLGHDVLSKVPLLAPKSTTSSS